MYYPAREDELSIFYCDRIDKWKVRHAVSVWLWINNLLVGGLEHEFYDFPYIGNVIIPIDFHIHPASRGVAAHTAGLFRSVRGAKGGFPRGGSPS